LEVSNKPVLHELSLRVKGSNLLTTDKPPNAKISQTLIPLCPPRLRGSLIRIIYFLEVPKTNATPAVIVVYQ